MFQEFWRVANVVFLSNMGKRDYADGSSKSFQLVSLTILLFKTLEKGDKYLRKGFLFENRFLKNQHAYMQKRVIEISLCYGA